MAATKKVIRGLKRLRMSIADLASDLKVNDLRAYVADGLLNSGAPTVDAVPEKFKTTAAIFYRIAGIQYTKAATTALVFTLGHIIAASKNGVVLVQINAAGTFSTKVPATTQSYATMALARAAKPAPDAGNVEVFTMEIANNAGAWTANTDDLTDASDVTSTTFVDATLKSLPAVVS
jgi:hypothetical protein